ncbi:Type IV pilus biogenesis protein PilQ [Methylophaga thiooxydans]|uniref:Type IV pilus biogenesis protein PilQ n=2 Tax=Methylophaga thiooxydans TaxID=392484 RepID=A0A0A0BI62_9GAMM|nr:Type IV pilus biogenesis protein PilQ [Methylophaga thiooxydans]
MKNTMMNKNGIDMNEQRLLNSEKSTLTAILNRFIFFFAVMFMSSTTYAAELKSLDFSALPGNKAKIQLVFSEPIAKPNSFSTDEPARIIVDFAGVANKLQERTKQVNVGVTRSISTVEAGERTRMVINLLQKAPYVISQNGNQMEITIDNANANANATQTTQRRSQSGMTTVTDVDFRRGEEGEARLIVKLDGEEAAMDVRQERGDIVIELANVALPDKLHRRLDVIDFATPVKFIDSDASANATKLTLTTEGRYEHLAYQSENTLVVEVKPLPEQPQAGQDRNQFGYSGEKLSLNFQNIEVRAVLQLLADFTGMNLVTSDTVKGNLTLRLKNVPWDQALDIILKTKGLAMRQNGNVLMVAPAAEIAAREKQELEAQKQLVELEPLYTEIVEIKFAKADLLATLLRTDGKQGGNSGQSGFLSPRGSITIDDRTNSLLIRDTADNLVDIRQVIDELDKPVRQVLIESRIVIANNDFNKELGVRFGTSAQSNTLGAGSSGSLTGLSTNPNNNDQIRADSVVGNDLNVNLPVSNPSGSIGLALAKLPLGMILELELSAMQAEGKGEVISSPRVITSNQQQATIEQGTEIPYQEATSSGATNVSFKEAVLKLDVTPQITPDDRIVMDLEVSKDEVGEVFLGVPSIDTRSVKTQVLVDNGETVVLGGIYEQSTNDNVERVPFFGDLPYVGFLFKNTFKEDRKRELLVFVTPKIVKEGLQY